MHRHKIRPTALMLASLFMAAGCSKFVPVEGRVVRGGQPVGGATVVFLPEAGGSLRAAYGPTDADGYFSLWTDNQAGMLPGKYRATVSKMKVVFDAPRKGAKESSPEVMPAGGRRRQELLPPQYADPATTPFHFEVPSGGKKDFLLDVKNESAGKT